MKRTFWTTLLILLAFIPVHGTADPVVRVCDDAAEFPPFIFYERTKGEMNRQKVKGAMVDVLKEISGMTGLDFSITLLPWKRCLHQVKDFDTYEMYMDGAFSNKRTESAYLTAPVFFLGKGYWYSAKRHPGGLQIKKLGDLKKFRILGIHGYTYGNYGFPDNIAIDMSAFDYETVFRKLDAGRGDVILGSIAIPYGFEALGRKMIPEGVRWQSLSQATQNQEPPSGFHIFISKRSPRAHELLTRINQAVVILNASGVTDRILKKYLPCGRLCY